MPFLVFVFGLIVGSFLNSLLYRLGGREKSIIRGHSECPHCGHELQAGDLIPLLSFFILRGRCRYCLQPISWQYPLVELATGICFVLIYFNFFPFGRSAEGGQFWWQLIFTAFLIVIFVYDLKHYLILDRVVFPAFILAAVYELWLGRFWQGLLGAVLLSGFFALLYIASKGRWLGLGDVKLGLFLGMLVAFPQTLALFFLAYFFGGVVALILLVIGRKKITDKLPFGTFLTVAAFLAMLWGERFIEWYSQLIGFR